MENMSFKLDAFEGPLDLLMHLIEKNKVNIYDIPIAMITEQYLAYLGEMTDLNMEFSSEFLVMAAHLLLIKSR
ncbi:MAG: segregation/condensation protein A, partial [Hyphomonadaceae bacterium]|nr:segregation/condensation protein A [Clostridia bacterium]